MHNKLKQKICMCGKEKGEERSMKRQGHASFLSVLTVNLRKSAVATRDQRTMCKFSFQTASELCDGETGTETIALCTFSA